MWEREDKYQERMACIRKTPVTFETGREARRRIRKENRKTNKIKA